jgi:hypothetical protein
MIILYLLKNLHLNENINTMAQQTAVQWLLSELQIRLLKIKSEPDGIVRERMINSFLIDAEQAEAMEKHQSMDLIKQTAMFMGASNFDKEIASMTYEDVYNSYYIK